MKYSRKFAVVTGADASDLHSILDGIIRLFEETETAGEIVSQDSDTEQAYLAFICKRLKLNFRKLSVEERKWLKKIAEKSDLLKNPKPQRGRR